MTKIKPEDIEFLAFEGGGGRGAAYLGSFIAFLHPAFKDKIFKYDEVRQGYVLNTTNIKGIAGTSAGSIASILLASKVPLESIMNLLINGGNTKLDNAPSLTAMLKKKKKTKKKQNFLESFNNTDLDIEYAICPSIVSPSGFTKVKRTNKARQQAIYKFYAKLGIDIDTRWGLISGLAEVGILIEKMLASLNVFDDLISDYGAAHGYTLRNYVDYMASVSMEQELQANPAAQKAFNRRYISMATVSTPVPDKKDKWYKDAMTMSEMPVFNVPDKLAKRKVLIPQVDNLNDWYSYTFGEHYQIFGTELVLCGTNVDRGQPTFFSYKYTPNVRIADALRISLSIPGFFKAFKVTDEDITKSMRSSSVQYTDYEQKTLLGTWVDGGVKNNLPIRAFDVDEQGARKENYGLGNFNPHLLGMALGRAEKDTQYPDLLKPSNKTGDILEYIMSLFDTIIANSSELQFHSEEEHQRVLDITTELTESVALSTYKFSPEPKVMATIVNNAVNETLEYFGISKAESPVNNIESGLYKDSVKGYLSFIKTNSML